MDLFSLGRAGAGREVGQRGTGKRNEEEEGRETEMDPSTLNRKNEAVLLC